jgi:hypothetical protein
MAAVTYKYEFEKGIQDYLDDFGVVQNFNPLLKLGSDLQSSIATDIMACVNAIPRTTLIPCSNLGFTPRKLIFLRGNGNSFSLYVPSKALLKVTAQCVVDLLKTSDYPIVCIKYEGEKWGNIYDRFNENITAKTPTDLIEPLTASGKNRVYYSGSMSEYASESGTTYQQIRPLTFKSQTREDGVPLGELEQYIASCVQPINTISCGTRSYISYRRFVVDFLVNTGDTLNPTKIQSVTIPSKEVDATLLAQCAKDLAGLVSSICLSYEGEHNDRFHLEGINLN